MSFFNRFVFNTFLFLALGCFGASSAFAVGAAGEPTTYTYYANRSNTICSTDSESICAANPTNAAHVAGCSGFTTTCDTGAYYNYSLSTRSCTVNSSYSYYDYQRSSTYVFDTKTKVCEADEEFKLVGCTAECVPKEPDPCEPKRGQRQTLAVACGTLSCGGGGKTIRTGSTFACSTGVGTFSASQPTSTGVKDSCALIALAQSSATPKLSDALAKTSDIGGSSLTMYCSQEYEYTGVTGGQDTPVPNANLSFYGAVPMPPSGLCPDDKPQPTHIGGVDACIDNQLPDSNCPIPTEKPNANGLCVPPTDPSYPKDNDPTKADPKTSCPTGQIRNNSGTCVPYADATKCPVGQVRDSVGTCSPDPKSNSCPTGQVKNKTTGACANDPRGTGCNDGSLPDNQGLCANGSASCSVGKTRNGSGYCVANGTNDPNAPSGTGCNDGSTPNSSGKCANGSASCPVGKVRASNGVCVADTTESNTTGTASSDCDVAPDCGGDPLQCASLEQIWRTGCEQMKQLGEISQEDADKLAASAVNAKSDAQAVQDGIDAEVEGYFSEFESVANSVSTTGQCVPDATLSIMGKSMTLAFSQACDFFRFLRIILLFSAYMFSARILFSGVS